MCNLIYASYDVFLVIMYAGLRLGMCGTHENGVYREPCALMA